MRRLERGLSPLLLLAAFAAACSQDPSNPSDLDEPLDPGPSAFQRGTAVLADPLQVEAGGSSGALSSEEIAPTRTLSLAAMFVVDDDGAQCPGALTTIQAAVDAAALSPGSDKIRVCAGTYPENVQIGPGPNSLDIKGDGVGVTIVTGVPATSDPIVHVDAAGAVTIADLTVDGLSNRSGAESTYGIRYDNADGRVRNAEVRNIRDAAGGVQGIGIGIISGSGGTAEVRVQGTLLENITRAHILVNGIGASGIILNNELIGPVLPKVWAPNGVQASRGGAAQIQNNELTDFISPNPSGGAGSGIILFCAGPTVAQDNFVTLSDLGISIADTQDGIVRNNAITESVFEGVSLQFIGTFFGPLGCPIFPSPTVDNQVVDNEIADSGDNGISLAGFDAANPLTPSGNRFVDNRVTGSGDAGIAVFAGIVGPDNPSDNDFIENEVSGSGVLSCLDQSMGSGTAGTANLWRNNSGVAPDQPDGICPNE